MWLVGNGGGNGSESYDLAWYFAAKHTYLEGFEKQNRKGFLFTFGDEPAPFQTMSKTDLKTIFGDGDYESMSPAASLAAAQEKFKVFHVVVERGYRSGALRNGWTNLLGTNVIFLRDTQYLTPVVIATMAIANGADPEAVIAESSCPEELRYAFSNSRDQLAVNW